MQTVQLVGLGEEGKDFLVRWSRDGIPNYAVFYDYLEATAFYNQKVADEGEATLEKIPNLADQKRRRWLVPTAVGGGAFVLGILSASLFRRRRR